MRSNKSQIWKFNDLSLKEMDNLISDKKEITETYKPCYACNKSNVKTREVQSPSYSRVCYECVIEKRNDFQLSDSTQMNPNWKCNICNVRYGCFKFTQILILCYDCDKRSDK